MYGATRRLKPRVHAILPSHPIGRRHRASARERLLAKDSWWRIVRMEELKWIESDELPWFVTEQRPTGWRHILVRSSRSLPNDHVRRVFGQETIASLGLGKHPKLCRPGLSAPHGEPGDHQSQRRDREYELDVEFGARSLQGLG